MQRDMSSPMDASLSTRNQGQLISTQTSVTRVQRVGGGGFMQETPLAHRQATRIPRGSAFGVRRVPRGNAYGISRANTDANVVLPITKAPGYGVSRAPGMSGDPSMLPGMGDITVSGLGTTTLKWIGVSMLAGIVLWKLTAGRRAKAKEAMGKVRAALKEAV